jgi:hypothetical protein
MSEVMAELSTNSGNINITIASGHDIIHNARGF